MGLRLGCGQPHRTTPHPGCPQRHRRRHLAAPGDPAGTEHRHRVNRVDDLRDQDHGADLTGVAAGFGALGDDQVDARVDVARRVLHFAGERPYPAPGRLDLIDHETRRRAQRVDEQCRFVGERDVQLGADLLG